MENGYRLVKIVDCYDNKTEYGAIYLNNKHKIEDFQNAINKAKEKWAKEIAENGDDWEYISRELGDFDYFDEVGTNIEYVEI